jgi:hypothetical protein
MNPDETDRVRAHTAPEILRVIDREIEKSIRYYATQPRHVISERIAELEREWDIERWLQTNASAIAGTSLLLGLGVNKKWFFLTGGVLAFLFQHAVQGWCPPVPVLRRIGIRTRSEIDCEKYALKALRGDFDNVPRPSENNEFIRANNAFHAVQA